MKLHELGELKRSKEHTGMCEVKVFEKRKVTQHRQSVLLAET